MSNHDDHPEDIHHHPVQVRILQREDREPALPLPPANVEQRRRRRFSNSWGPADREDGLGREGEEGREGDEERGMGRVGDLGEERRASRWGEGAAGQWDEPLERPIEGIRGRLAGASLEDARRPS